MSEFFDYLGISEPLRREACEAEALCAPQFEEIERIREANQMHVLSCFIKERVSPMHFAPSYGYGYDDAGREKLESLFARIFKAEAALVRPAIASGTHAIALCLRGLLKSGDELVSLSGTPYDTLEAIIGTDKKESGSLSALGVHYSVLPLVDGRPDYEKIPQRSKNAAVVMLQRSRGYMNRPSLTVAEIKKICALVHSANPQTVVFVDNCYGEFVEESEPIEAGADVIVGSLIKNPGGGIAPAGAYIAGKSAFIEKIAAQMTAPGVGGEIGSYAASYMPFFQGIYLAPHVVGEALKGAVFAAAMLEKKGYKPSPTYNEKRGCIIQSVMLFAPEKLIEFCKALQHVAPVDSFVVPQPAPMPGYADQIIMAAGTFIQGSSIELSGDGPMREPYMLYMQGGTVYAQVKAAVLYALSKTNC